MDTANDYVKRLENMKVHDLTKEALDGLDKGTVQAMIFSEIGAQGAPASCRLVAIGEAGIDIYSGDFGYEYMGNDCRGPFKKEEKKAEKSAAEQEKKEDSVAKGEDEIKDTKELTDEEWEKLVAEVEKSREELVAAVENYQWEPEWERLQIEDLTAAFPVLKESGVWDLSVMLRTMWCSADEEWFHISLGFGVHAFVRGGARFVKVLNFVGRGDFAMLYEIPVFVQALTFPPRSPRQFHSIEELRRAMYGRGE